MLKRVINLFNPVDRIKSTASIASASIQAMNTPKDEGGVNQLYAMDEAARRKDAKRLVEIAVWQMIGGWFLALLSYMSYGYNPTGFYVAIVLVVASTLAGVINLWRSNTIAGGK